MTIYDKGLIRAMKQAYKEDGNYVYGRNWFGCMFIRTEMVVHEDVPLLDHLAEMQWIPVEIADV